jgi:lipid-A-disaccharide synthase
MGGHTKNVLIVTGEASGDLHGSNLVRELLKIDTSVRVYGVGGKKMKEAGVEILFDAGELAVVGISEVLRKAPTIFKAYRKLKRTLDSNRPDLVVLIDYPGFNLHFAKEVRKRAIPIVYYISPQVWAWRKRRGQKIAELVDKMLVIFPFEVPIYKHYNLDVTYVGHPLLDEVECRMRSEEIRGNLNLKHGTATVALIPGSRCEEITRILPVMYEAARIIKASISKVQFVLPIANTLDVNFVNGFLDNGAVPIKIVENNLYGVLSVSDCAMVTSGTATLETAFMAVPMVIVYKVSPLSYIIGKTLIKTDYISLPNIVADKKIVPELIQNDASPEKIAEEILRIFEVKNYSEDMKMRLRQVRKILGKGGASERAANMVYGMLDKGQTMMTA